MQLDMFPCIRSLVHMALTILNTPLPKPRSHKPRLTAEMKTLEVGQSFMTDFKTSRCFASWCNLNGRKAVTRQVSPGVYQAGRLA